MKNTTKKYKESIELDLSCSEAILYAANEKYNLNLTEREFHMLAPFSGGMYEGDTCGIVTASISVLGILLTDGVSHKSPLLREAVIEYKDKFRERYQDVHCAELIKSYRSENTGCNDLIINASELLEEVIEKYVKLK